MEDWEDEREKSGGSAEEVADPYIGLKSKIPTRMDFLHISVDDSIITPGNLALKKHLMVAEGGVIEDWMRIENKEEWSRFPELEAVKDFTQGRGVRLLACLVYLFAPTLLNYNRKKWSSYTSECETKDKNADVGLMLDMLTLNDLVFIFMQLQNNSNRWLLLHKAWKMKKGPEAWKDKTKYNHCKTMKGLTLKTDKERLSLIEKLGTEFPKGSSVLSGKEGKHRHEAVERCLYLNYYKRGDEACLKNREALKQAIREFDEESMEKAKAKLDSLGKQDEPNATKKKQARELVIQPDEVTFQIQGLMWADHGATGGLFQV